MNAGFGQIFKHAKKLQEGMEQMNEEVENLEATGEAGAGLVRVVMTGKHDLKSVNIDDSLLQEDKEVLEDLIAAAVNDASRKIEAEKKGKMSSLTDGVPFLGGMKLPL